MERETDREDPPIRAIEEDEDSDTYALVIDDEKMEVKILGRDPPFVSTRRREFYVFKDRDSAGEAARDYYKAMADDSPDELRSMIGDETLIEWALGHLAGPGVQVRSLDEWCDLWRDNPEEHFASHDGEEREGRISARLADELGIDHDPDDLEVEVVCYRSN